MTKRVLFKIILVSGLILAVVYMFRYTKRSQEKPPEIQAKKDSADTLPLLKESNGIKSEIKMGETGEEQRILSFDMTGYTKDQRKKWEIRGESADIISDTILLSNIEADAYTKDRTVTLRADRGTYDRAQNSVILESDVIVTTSDGITLGSEWFEWNSQTDNIHTDSFVEVEKDGLYASGYGAFASTRDKEVQLERDVFVKQGEMKINCSGPLMIDYANNSATFYDNVEVNDPRGQMIADRLNVFFNPDTGTIEEAVAEGNVELWRDENVATGQKIVYIVTSGEAVLTGNPEIIIYSKKDLEDAFTGN